MYIHIGGIENFRRSRNSHPEPVLVGEEFVRSMDRAVQMESCILLPGPITPDGSRRPSDLDRSSIYPELVSLVIRLLLNQGLELITHM